jgi:hypothetical protein
VLKLAYALSLVCLLLLPANSFAQTRQRTTTRRTTTRGRSTSALSATALNEARLSVAEDLKILTRFLYLYGRTSVGVESNEQQARQGGGDLSPQTAAILNKSKATIQQSVSDIRDRLDKLALYFRTTSAVSQYSGRVSDLAAAAAGAEQRANAGQFDAAGRTLIDVANQLTDLLLEMQ